VVVDSSNAMVIWGSNFEGFIQRDPILFFQFKYPIRKIALGIKHGLAIDENQKLYAWGDGTYGEIGEDLKCDKEIGSGLPTKVAYFDNKDIKVHSVSAGLRHSIVVDIQGKIYSFGDNSFGQLGTIENRQYHPS